MTINELAKHIEFRLKQLNQMLVQAEENIGNLPEGTLIMMKLSGKTRYYHRINGKRKYLGKDDKTLLNELEEKNYLAKYIKAAKTQLNNLSKAAELIGRAEDPESVFLKLPKQSTHLIEPFDIKGRERSAAFVDKTNKQKDLPVSKNLVTDEGEIVRSKSELIIANKLHAAGVEYGYELPYAMGEFDWYKVKPDFTVLNKRTGEVFFWEHFGMMDNPEYLVAAQIKLENYSEGGFFLGKNLIVTMESSGHPINTGLIDRYIKEFLL